MSWLDDRRSWLAHRRNAFTVIYTLVPLSAFVAFSLFHEVKLSWTGPVWLAILPALAGRLVAQEPTESSANLKHRSWLATVALALLIYGAALHYFVLGLPGIGHSTSMSLKALPIGWKEFGAEVEKIKTDLEKATGKEPLRVGMDRYFLSSEIAFYDPDQDAASYTAGRSLFGFDSLMYDRWFPSAAAKGRDILLVSRGSNGPIAAESLSARFQTLGPIQEHIVHKGDVLVSRFFYRIGYSYIPVATASPDDATRAGQRVGARRLRLGSPPMSIYRDDGTTSIVE